MATLATFRTNLRLDLGGTITEFSDAEVDRAVQRAVNDLSRFFPREQLLDVAVNDLDVTDESWTTNATITTYTSLANSPIQGQSEIVQNTVKTVTYARGTDYEIDYLNGKLRRVTGSTMAASTAYLITYAKHRNLVSISSITTNLLGIYRVEYRLGQVVQQYKAFSIWNNFLFVGAGINASQEHLAEASNLWVYYYTGHDAPTASVAGTYPTELDEVVTKGTAGYLLIAIASKRNIQAVADAASARTRLGSIAAVHTSMGTVHALVTTALAATATKLGAVSFTLTETALAASATKLGTISFTTAEAALAKVETYLGSATVSAKSAISGITNYYLYAQLTAAAAALAKVTTYLESNTSNDAKTVLAAQDVATANTQVAAAATALALMATHLTAGTFSVKATLDAISQTAGTNALALGTTAAALIPTKAGEAETSLDAIATGDPATNLPLAASKTALDKVPTSVDAATNSAHEALEALAWTDPDVVLAAASTEAAFAATAMVAMPLLWTAGDKGQEHLNKSTALTAGNLSADDYLDAGDALINTVNTGEDAAGHNNRYAQASIAISQTFISAMAAYAEEAKVRIEEANAYLNSAQVRVNRQLGKVQEANGRLGMAEEFIREAQARIAAANAYISDRQVQVNRGTALNTNAGLYAAEAETRVAIGLAYLKDNDVSLSKAGQYKGISETFALEATQRNVAGQSYTAVEQVRLARANSYINLSNSFIAEAAERIAAANAYSTDNQTLIAEASQYINMGSTFVEEATQRISEEALRLANAKGYLDEAAQRLSEEATRIEQARGYIQEAAGRVAQISEYRMEAQVYIEEASAYLRTSEAERQSAEVFQKLGEAYRIEYFSVLRERAGMRKNNVSVSDSQHMGV